MKTVSRLDLAITQSELFSRLILQQNVIMDSHNNMTAKLLWYYTHIENLSKIFFFNKLFLSLAKPSLLTMKQKFKSSVLLTLKTSNKTDT